MERYLRALRALTEAEFAAEEAGWALFPTELRLIAYGVAGYFSYDNAWGRISRELATTGTLAEIRSEASRMTSAYGEWGLRPTIEARGQEHVRPAIVMLTRKYDGAEIVIDLDGPLGGPTFEVNLTNEESWVRGRVCLVPPYPSAAQPEYDFEGGPWFPRDLFEWQEAWRSLGVEPPEFPVEIKTGREEEDEYDAEA